VQRCARFSRIGHPRFIARRREPGRGGLIRRRCAGDDRSRRQDCRHGVALLQARGRSGDDADAVLRTGFEQRGLPALQPRTALGRARHQMHEQAGSHAPTICT
jgi:hypothetical protein